MEQLVREWVMSCEQCIQELRIDCRLTHPPLQNPNDYITAPDDAKEIGLMPELPSFGDSENIVTTIDVF